MTDDWDFYFCRIDDRPASTFVDLGALEYAPSTSLPYLGYVRVVLNDATADGLSSAGESKVLAAIEDALEDTLVAPHTGYVGRCTTAGARDFYYYTSAAEGWKARVDEAMQAFPAYDYDADARPDPEWTTYLGYLAPGDEDRQRIENRRVCESLEAGDDALTEPREIDHWAYFAEAAQRDAFVAAAAGLGFAVRLLIEPDADLPDCGAQLWRTDIPGYETIDEITLPLFELANHHGGSYDGWECEVIAGPAPPDLMDASRQVRR